MSYLAFIIAKSGFAMAWRAVAVKGHVATDPGRSAARLERCGWSAADRRADAVWNGGRVDWHG